MTEPEAPASMPPASDQIPSEGGHAPWTSAVWASRVLAVAAPFLVYALVPGDLSEEARLALAIACFAFVSWITHALDYAITGMIACYLCWVLEVVEFHTAFHGFGTSTPWFVFAAMLFGTMLVKSGLARRLAYLLMRAVGHSYSRLLLGLLVSGFLLSLLVPSGIARVVVLAVVALGLVEAFGAGPGSNLGRGLFILLSVTTPIFSNTLIAGEASLAASELIGQVGQVEVLRSQWLLALLPFDLILIVAAWRLTTWLYPPEHEALPGGADAVRAKLRDLGPWSKLEKRTALLGAVGVGLWATTALHGIPAPLIGIGMGFAAALPMLGVLDESAIKKFDFLPVLFVGSAVSVSAVLVETHALSGLTGWLTTAVGPYLESAWTSSVVLFWTAFAYHVVSGEETSMLAASLPALMQAAQARGLDALPLGMIWTVAAGAKIFVYQSAVLVVGHSYGYFDGRDLLRVGLALAVVQSLALIVLTPLYWPLIGL